MKVQDQFHYLKQRLKRSTLIVFFVYKYLYAKLPFPIFVFVFRRLAIDAIRTESLTVAIDVEPFCICRILSNYKYLL